MNCLSQKSRSLLVVIGIMCTTFAIIGCGGEKGPELFRVTGTVTVDGQPLEKVGVAFQPDESKGNKNGLLPAGITDPSGKYELETATRKGAPVGPYKVVVIPYSAPPGGGEVPKSAAIPFDKKYSLDDKTDLTYEVVKSSSPQVFDIKLTK